MDSSRPLTPREPIKLNAKQQRLNKTIDRTTFMNGNDSKGSQKVTTISQRSDGQYQQNISRFQEPDSQIQLQVINLKTKLSKQEEKNYIYEHFFKKIQKALYNQTSQHLQGSQIKDYEKLQLHLTDMVKRVKKSSQYNKLAAVPVIYRKQNTVTTRTVTYRPTKK